jgi:hypothetical protein
LKARELTTALLFSPLTFYTPVTKEEEKEEASEEKTEEISLIDDRLWGNLTIARRASCEDRNWTHVMDLLL